MALKGTYWDHVALYKQFCVPVSPFQHRGPFSLLFPHTRWIVCLGISGWQSGTVIPSVTKLDAKNISLDQAISSKVSSCSQKPLSAIFSLQPWNSPCSSSEPNTAILLFIKSFSEAWNPCLAWANGCTQSLIIWQCLWSLRVY